MTETSVHGEPVALPTRSFGRVARSVAGYSVGTALMMLLSPAFVFVPAALFHCGLRNGRRAAWLTLALAVAMLSPYLIQSPLSSPDGRFAVVFFAGLILGIGVPALLVLPLVERAEPFGRVLMAALLVAVGGFALTEISARSTIGYSPYAEQLARANESTTEVVAMYQKAGMPSDAVQMFQRGMSYFEVVMPASSLIVIALAFVLSLMMLGRLQAWRIHAASLPEEQDVSRTYHFRNLSLPDWLLFAFIAGGLTPLLAGLWQKIAANVLTLVAFLYLLQGLAILRSVLATAGASFLSVMFGFLVLAVLAPTGIPQLLLSITGLFDSFFDFRHFKRKDDSHESHTD
jgi:hypothetical protein